MKVFEEIGLEFDLVVVLFDIMYFFDEYVELLYYNYMFKLLIVIELLEFVEYIEVKVCWDV